MAFGGDVLHLLLMACAQANPPTFTLDSPPPVETDPFVWDATGEAVTPDAPGAVTLRLVIPPDHFVYRDRVSIDVVQPGGLTVGTVVLPPGVVQPDVAGDLPNREQYPTDVFIRVPLSSTEASPTGLVEVGLEVRHQGCRPGLCFPPTTTPLTALVPVRSAD